MEWLCMFAVASLVEAWIERNKNASGSQGAISVASLAGAWARSGNSCQKIDWKVEKIMIVIPIGFKCENLENEM